MAFMVKNSGLVKSGSGDAPFPILDQYIRVDRATADVLTSAAVALFDVRGGYVLVKALIGEVTTAVGAGTTPDFKFQFDPDTGTTIDLSANVSVASDEVGTLYSITGLRTDATQEGSSGAVRTMSHPLILGPEGEIECICDEDVAGSIKFSIWYQPLDKNAHIVAV